MKIPFFKMHGLGNDYIFIDNRENKIKKNFNTIAKKLSDRHFSIGSDGLVLLSKSDKAVIKMEIFNADGSKAELCGNALRCVAKFCYDNCLTSSKTFKIETSSDVKQVEIIKSSKKMSEVCVNIGKFSIMKNIFKNSDLIDEKFSFNNQTFYLNGINLDNPHCVVFVKNFPKNISEIGNLISNSNYFPKRANVEFVKLSKNCVKIKIYERGSGITLACGSGACAVAVACCIKKYFDFNTEIKVKMDYGSLKIVVNENSVYMTGSANYVFSGEIDI